MQPEPNPPRPARRRRLGLRLTAVAVAAVVAGAAVLAFGSRPELDGARRRVEVSWSKLRPALDDRYGALAAASAAVAASFEGAAAGPESVTRAIDRSGSRWAASAREPVEAQVALANQIEGLARRLSAVVAGTPRLRGATEVGVAVRAFESAQPGPAATGYNEAVSGYEDTRGGFPRSLVALVLGFDARRTFEPATAPS